MRRIASTLVSVNQSEEYISECRNAKKDLARIKTENKHAETVLDHGKISSLFMLEDANRAIHEEKSNHVKTRKSSRAV